MSLDFSNLIKLTKYQRASQSFNNCASQTWSTTRLAGSALAVECPELWSMRLHTICHISRKTNHLCSMHYFQKIQNAVLILSQDLQERIAQESLLRQIFLFRLLFLSFSRSLALLSWSFALYVSLYLYVAWTGPLSLSLPLSLCLSNSSSRFLSLSHTITH